MREDEKYRFWLMILEEKLKNNNLFEKQNSNRNDTESKEEEECHFL
jgi:hypothetical protein